MLRLSLSGEEGPRLGMGLVACIELLGLELREDNVLEGSTKLSAVCGTGCEIAMEEMVGPICRRLASLGDKLSDTLGGCWKASLGVRGIARCK